MSEHYIDVRVHFDKETEEDGYNHYSPISVEGLGGTIPEDEQGSIGEAAHQSDQYTVYVSNAFLTALGEIGTIKLDKW